MFVTPSGHLSQYQLLVYENWTLMVIWLSIEPKYIKRPLECEFQRLLGSIRVFIWRPSINIVVTMHNILPVDFLLLKQYQRITYFPNLDLFVVFTDTACMSEEYLLLLYRMKMLFGVMLHLRFTQPHWSNKGLIYCIYTSSVIPCRKIE